MGKSFANFMCKKFFHPSSFANIKRVWLAEQRVAEETQKQDELRAEYERDQDHYNNRQLMGDERVKNGLTFIYEAPKAYQTEPSDQGKLEWKRDTPMEAEPASILPGLSQDNGATVRKVRCVKCHEMGHINTDKECPRYEASRDEETKAETVHQDQLVAEMRRDGYAFKQNVLGRSIQDETYNKHLVAEEDSDDGPPPEEAFLNSLTKKQKKKLLKKLNRLENKHSGSVHKKKKSKKLRRRSDSSSDAEPRKKKQKSKKHKRVDSSCEDSSSDESSDGRRRKQSRPRRRSSTPERYERRQGSEKSRRDDEKRSVKKEDERRSRSSQKKHSDHRQAVKQELRGPDRDDDNGYRRGSHQQRRDDEDAGMRHGQMRVKKELQNSSKGDTSREKSVRERSQKKSSRRHGSSSSDSDSDSGTEKPSRGRNTKKHRGDSSDDDRRRVHQDRDHRWEDSHGGRRDEEYSSQSSSQRRRHDTRDEPRIKAERSSRDDRGDGDRGRQRVKEYRDRR